MLSKSSYVCNQYQNITFCPILLASRISLTLVVSVCVSSSVVRAAISNKLGVGPAKGPRPPGPCGNRGPIFLCAANGSNPERLGSAPNRSVDGRRGESKGLGPPTPRRRPATPTPPGRGDPSGILTPGRGDGKAEKVY